MCLWFCLFLFVYPCLLSTSNLLRKQHTNLSLKSTSSRWQVYECRCWVSISVRCLFGQCVYISVNRTCRELDLRAPLSYHFFRNTFSKNSLNGPTMPKSIFPSGFTIHVDIFDPDHWSHSCIPLSSVMTTSLNTLQSTLRISTTNLCSQWDNFEINLFNTKPTNTVHLRERLLTILNYPQTRFIM